MMMKLIVWMMNMVEMMTIKKDNDIEGIKVIVINVIAKE